MSFIKFIKHIFAPEPGQDTVAEQDSLDTITSQNVLDAFTAAFKHSLKEETTTESMLCHTFYKLYIHEDFYDKISARFHKTAQDAVKVFTRILKQKRSDYPDFTPFATRWEFHLISLSDGMKIQGAENSAGNNIIITSRLWAPNAAADEEQESDDERIVVTFHDKNSLLKTPKGFNFALLNGLIAAEKDKAIFRFTLDDEPTSGKQPRPTASISTSGTSTKQDTVLAVIRINEGTFIDGNRTFTTYNMKTPTLRIAGKNGSISNDGVPVLCINSDKILNYHVEITFDSASKTFKIAAMGDTKLNECRLKPDANTRVTLPYFSNITLADFDLTFKAK